MAGTHAADEGVVEIKQIDPAIASRRVEYPWLTDKGIKVMVTGGGATAEATVSLLSSAGCAVTVLSTNTPTTSAPTRANVTCVVGSVKNRADCDAAVDGQDVVIHTRRSPRSGSAARETQILLDAAAAAGVKAFVFESTASVVSTGREPTAVGEDSPYAHSFLDAATAAVAEAEKVVLAANAKRVRPQESAGGILTCSVRAARVYGPGDTEGFLPELVRRARTRTRPVGDGSNVIDFVYAGNVAHGLLLAAQGLLASAAGGSASLTSPAGRVYCVTDSEPVPFSDFSGRALARLGYSGPESAAGVPGMPVWLCTLLAAFFYYVAMIISPVFDWRPTLTPRRVAEESRTWRFDIAWARKELGYEPLWTQEEGLDLSLQSAASLRNPAAKAKYVGPFTAEEVARHSAEDDAWIIVDGKVYDVTSYLDQHPGGDAMLRNAGGDSTEGMHGPQHPPQAFEILDQHYIGPLET